MNNMISWADVKLKTNVKMSVPPIWIYIPSDAQMRIPSFGTQQTMVLGVYLPDWAMCLRVWIWMYYIDGDRHRDNRTTAVCRVGWCCSNFMAFAFVCWVYSKVYADMENYLIFVFAICSSKMKTRLVTRDRFTEKLLSRWDNFQLARSFHILWLGISRK